LNRIKFRIRYKKYKGKLKGYETTYLTIDCKEMAKDIDDLGFESSKSEQKSVPDYIVHALKKAKEMSELTNIEWWLTTPGQVALAFLLGFYDGDGSYKGGRKAVIYASSKPFLKQIKELFEIENRILTCKEPGEEALVFDHKYISSGFYSLALGPKLLDMMMNSYEYSMERKRPQDSAG